jgi:hypothetical protein
VGTRPFSPRWNLRRRLASRVSFPIRQALRLLLAWSAPTPADSPASCSMRLGILCFNNRWTTPQPPSFDRLRTGSIPLRSIGGEVSMYLPYHPAPISCGFPPIGMCKAVRFRSSDRPKETLNSLNLDSRRRGNDRKVSFLALRAVIPTSVIPAKAGIQT